MSSRRWLFGGDRFVTPETLAALVLAGFALLTFGTFTVHGDGVGYFLFLRRLLGRSEPLAYAYQVGAALWNVPFYVVGAAVDHGQAAIGVASAVAALLTVWLVWRLLVLLQLPRGIFILAAAVLGTPLWFYVVYEPSYTHAVDALALSAASVALGLAVERTGVAWPLVLGACLGFLPAVRYANVVLVPVLLCGLALGRGWRIALWAALAAAVTGATLLLLPLVAGIDYGTPPVSVNREVARASFDALAPLKMLVSLHRGLFVWTPLTLLAAVGVVLYLRRAVGQRLVVGTLAAGFVAVLLLHIELGRPWWAGFSFSQRFLASFVPLYAIGTAELVRRSPRIAVAFVTIAVVFSLFIGVSMHVGYEHQSEADGVNDIISTYVDGSRTLPGLVRTLGVDARDRWKELLP
jgi:hypothetical protein